MPLNSNQAGAVERFDPGSGQTVGFVQISSGRTGFAWQDAFKLAAAGGSTGVARAAAVAQSLNSLFAQTARDADFITPSIVYADPAVWPAGAYAVVWTDVRSSDTCTAPRDFSTPECLYAGCGLTIQTCRPDVPAYPKRDKATYQTDLVYIRTEDRAIYGNDVPWDLALYMANRLRLWIDGTDMRGRTFTPLADPVASLHNYTGGTVSRTGTFYAGGELLNIAGSCNAGAENIHTADLTCAIDYVSQNDPLGCYAWVKITDPRNGKNIAARITDQAPAGTVDGMLGGLGWYFRSQDPDFPNGCYNGTMNVGAL